MHPHPHQNKFKKEAGREGREEGWDQRRKGERKEGQALNSQTGSFNIKFLHTVEHHH